MANMPVKPARLAQFLQLEREGLVAEPDNKAVQSALVPLATTAGKQLWLLSGDRHALARWFHYQPLVLCEERTPKKLVAAGQMEELDLEVERAGAATPAALRLKCDSPRRWTQASLPPAR